MYYSIRMARGCSLIKFLGTESQHGKNGTLSEREEEETYGSNRFDNITKGIACVQSCYHCCPHFILQKKILARQVNIKFSAGWDPVAHKSFL